ncbi:MAG TPA: hypothetical protein VLF91_01215 [Candidatus Saccharimonadales bacterium]|nr:hypothetical protein [Candidatus Saccharimonadales bacterium]
MARTTLFTKRTLISKANTSMVIATTVAAFIVVFTLVAGKSLISQMTYQNHVLSAKKTALNQLKDDLAARDTLQSAYNSFVAENPNLLGGDPSGSGARDGDNAALILDALPSAYDFPALTNSLEALINSENLKIMSITGVDQEVTQGANSSSPSPQAVAMPFSIQVGGSYQSVQNLVNVFSASIRPFQIQTITLTGNQSNMTATISAQTYYQPGKNLTIKSETVQ